LIGAFIFLFVLPTFVPPILLFLFKNRKGENLKSSYTNIRDIPVTTLEGKQYDKLEDLVKGKKLLLVVNVASNSFLAE
jgi:hypothetical protein